MLQLLLDLVGQGFWSRLEFLKSSGRPHIFRETMAGP